jgi:hypothetical protein
MDTPTEVLNETIRRELPGLLRADPSFRNYILELTRQEYAERAESRDRFHEILGELRRDREEQAKMYAFERKARFDESRHNRKAQRITNRRSWVYGPRTKNGQHVEGGDDELEIG